MRGVMWAPRWLGPCIALVLSACAHTSVGEEGDMGAVRLSVQLISREGRSVWDGTGERVVGNALAVISVPAPIVRQSEIVDCDWDAVLSTRGLVNETWVAVLNTPAPSESLRPSLVINTTAPPDVRTRCLEQAGVDGAVAVLALPSVPAVDWATVGAVGVPPVVVLPADAAGTLEGDVNSTGLRVTFSMLTTTPTPVPTDSTPFITPTIIIHTFPVPERDDNGGGSHSRVIIFVCFCIACFFVSSLYCRTRTTQVQNNTALRRSMWLVTLLEHEASTQQRLQIRSEAAGRIFASMPVRTVGEVDPNDPESGPASKPDDCCCICLDDFHQGDKVATLPCNHEFHSPCIAPWLEQQCTCPLCKRDLIEGSGEDPSIFDDAVGMAPPEGWRRFLEHLLEDAGMGRRQVTLYPPHPSPPAERPPAPEPPVDMDADAYDFEYFQVDFGEEGNEVGSEPRDNGTEGGDSGRVDAGEGPERQPSEDNGESPHELV
eukprot:m.77000 g.77000  ORF g.77000 m.77000 type:complete len:488 (+) comp9108_c0_seq1:61-1524(+)